MSRPCGAMSSPTRVHEIESGTVELEDGPGHEPAQRARTSSPGSLAPLYRDAAGLPIGVQLVAAYGRETSSSASPPSSKPPSPSSTPSPAPDGPTPARLAVRTAHVPQH